MLFRSALAEFQLCLNLVQGLDEEKRGLSRLWVPVILDETLAFEERDHPDLLEAVWEAKTSIEYVLAHP